MSRSDTLARVGLTYRDLQTAIDTNDAAWQAFAAANRLAEATGERRDRFRALRLLDRAQAAENAQQKALDAYKAAVVELAAALTPAVTG